MGEVRPGGAGRLPDSSDAEAVPLPEASDFREFYSLITAVCEHLTGMTAEWWHRHHFKPSPATPGLIVIRDPEAAAAWHRRRAAKYYRDQLRNQLLRLWRPGTACPPNQDPDPEADIRNQLTPWAMRVIQSACSAAVRPIEPAGAGDDFRDANHAKAWLDSQVSWLLKSLHECYTGRLGNAITNTAIATPSITDLSPEFRERQLSLIRQDILVIRDWALRNALPGVPPAPSQFRDRDEAQAAFSEWCAYLDGVKSPPSDQQTFFANTPMNPLQLLKDSVKYFPRNTYAFGVVGVVAAAAICARLMSGDYVAAILGGVTVFAGMVLLRVFASAAPTVNKRVPKPQLAQVVLTWFALLLFMAVALIGLVKFYKHLFPSAAIINLKIHPGEPTPAWAYPEVHEIAELPSKETVNQPPAVPANKVTFGYMNATDIPLRLLLFNCHYHYSPKTDDPMKRQEAFLAWDLPAVKKITTVSGFREGTGWYAFFVVRCDTGERIQLGTKNIFYSDRPTLVVNATGDRRVPFKAVFSSQDASHGYK